jgi:hypothetical protein
MSPQAPRLLVLVALAVLPFSLRLPLASARRAAAAAVTMTNVAPQQARVDTLLPVPFVVGERLVYDVKFGPLKVGTGSMEIMGVEQIRGRDTWHAKFRVKGGTFFYKVNDTYESWIDTAHVHSLRYKQDINEGRYDRERLYEFYPDRKVYTENDKPEQPMVADPLDDASFLYFIRTVPLEIGQTYEFERYFKPDRNPVRIKVLRRERVSVPAGTFQAIVIQPMIHNAKLFSDNGKAEIWLAEDSTRMMVQMKSNLSFGSLNLYLKSARLGPEPVDSAAKPSGDVRAAR